MEGLASSTDVRTSGARAWRCGSRGLTLVEILIVVTLIALLSGSLIFGSGMLTGARQRAAATLVVAGVRKGLAEANASGKPVRLAIDLDSSRVTLEEAKSSALLRDEVTTTEGESENDRAQDTARLVREQTDRVLEGMTPDRPSFSPTDALGQDGDKPGRELGGGVRFRMVQTEHDPEPRTDGTAYIYFWPGGLTEHAVVQVGRSAEDEGLTVKVSALTGRAEIKRGRIELPEPRLDGEYSEREEAF